MASSPLSSPIIRRSSGSSVSAESLNSREKKPTSAHAASLRLTYICDAGSSPTSTTARPGTIPLASLSRAVFSLISLRMSFDILVPSIIAAIIYTNLLLHNSTAGPFPDDKPFEQTCPLGSPPGTPRCKILLVLLKINRHLHQRRYLIIGHAAAHNGPARPVFVEKDCTGTVLLQAPRSA